MSCDLWILYSSYYDNDELNSAKKMLNKALEFNINAELKFFDYFEIKNKDLFYKNNLVGDFPRIVFFRGHDIELIKYFEEKGVYVVNKAFTTIVCKDKWQTNELVKSLNIKTPNCEIFNGQDFYYCKEKYGLPFLIKYRYGAQGKSIFLINSLDEFSMAIANINNSDYMIQEYIKSSFGKDLRVYMIKNTWHAACMRANENSFMSNIAQGGKSYPYELSDDDYNKALKIFDKLDGDIISVDFLFGENELIFCEANTNAGFASFNYLGYNVRDYMMKYIKNKLNEMIF